MSEVLHHQENQELKQKSLEELKQDEEKLVKKMDNYKELKRQLQKEEKRDEEQDQKSLQQIEDYLNGKTEEIEISGEHEQKLSEKEKILNYGKLSELSYIHLGPDTERELEITKIEIDPVLLANIDKIFDIEKPENLSPQ